MLCWKDVPCWKYVLELVQRDEKEIEKDSASGPFCSKGRKSTKTRMQKQCSVFAPQPSWNRKQYNIQLITENHVFLLNTMQKYVSENLKEQGLHSDHHTLSLRLTPATLERKLVSAFCICHLILSATTQSSWLWVRGWNLDQPNWKLHFLAQLPLHHSGLAQCLECCWCPQKMLLVKTPRYFNAFVWGDGSSPNRRVQSIIFQHGTMASDLEVLTLVATSLHSAANRLGALSDWRSRQNRVICKKQRCHSDIRKPNILLTTAAPRDPVQACPWHTALYSVQTDTNYFSYCEELEDSWQVILDPTSFLFPTLPLIGGLRWSGWLNSGMRSEIGYSKSIRARQSEVYHRRNSEIHNID